MSYQVLARKWRPRGFDAVLGQAHVVRALCNALELGRLHHAYLFAGTRGVGKTTLARILAKCLNCDSGVVTKPCGECSACTQIDEGRFVDLIEIDAASRTGVDDMRELLEDVHYAPAAGRFKVYLIDEVHMLSLSSFNALLKTLEEPPDHVKFFFATTHPQKLPVTILSRCLQFNLTRLLPGELQEYLAAMLKTEAVAYEDAALKQIAIAAEGSVRDGLSLLDQAIAYGNGSLKTQEVAAMLGLAARDEVSGLLRCVTANDAAGLLERIENMYRKAVDFAGVLGDLIELLHAVAVHQAVPDAEPPAQFDAAEVAALAGAMTHEDTQLFYQIALNGKRDLPFLPDARNAFEMTMLRMLSFRLADAAPAGKASAATGTTAAARSPAAASAATNRPASASASLAPAASASARATPPKSVRSPAAPGPAPANRPAAFRDGNPGGAAGAASPMQGDGGGHRDGGGSRAAGKTTEALRFSDFAAAEGWLELIGRLHLAGAQREICLNSVFSVQSESEVTLALDEQMHPAKTPALEAKIRDALSRAAGRKVKVNFNLASPDEETPEQAKQRKRLARQRDAERSVDEDATVQSFKDDFDASIVPDSTKPVADSGPANNAGE